MDSLQRRGLVVLLTTSRKMIGPLAQPLGNGCWCAGCNAGYWTRGEPDGHGGMVYGLHEDGCSIVRHVRELDEAIALLEGGS